MSLLYKTHVAEGPYVTSIISLFNHKGGVSKTTTAFNLGWGIAELGKRVLLVDADPQCNLSGLTLGLSDGDSFAEFYQKHPEGSIASGLAPVFEGRPEALGTASLFETKRERLYICPGHIDLALHETQLAVALATGSSMPALRNLPGSLGKYLRQTADKHEIDIVIVDMSPSVGALNQCLLLASDFFIIPTSPDFYCDQAMRSLGSVLPRWNREVEAFRDQSLAAAFPRLPPVCLGIISQRYRPRDGKPAKSFQSWIDKIRTTMNDTLVPALLEVDMMVDRTVFEEAIGSTELYNLANIADFNSLIAQAQLHAVPPYRLTDDQLDKQGVVLTTMRESRDQFAATFEGLSKGVVSLIELNAKKRPSAFGKG